MDTPEGTAACLPALRPKPTCSTQATREAARKQGVTSSSATHGPRSRGNEADTRTGLAIAGARRWAGAGASKPVPRGNEAGHRSRSPGQALLIRPLPSLSLRGFLPAPARYRCQGAGTGPAPPRGFTHRPAGRPAAARPAAAPWRGLLLPPGAVATGHLAAPTGPPLPVAPVPEPGRRPRQSPPLAPSLLSRARGGRLCCGQVRLPALPHSCPAASGEDAGSQLQKPAPR